jgi:OPA family glycerol-3-phosphate transporter-like MFS transporter
MSEPAPPRLRRWQDVTVGALAVGYAGYYVGRAVLPVAYPHLRGDPDVGFDELAYGRLVAAGTLAYGFGKLVNGVAAEYLGGRFVFLAGMALSAVCVAAFGLAAGAAALLAAWAANRFAQSMGWVGVVQVAGRWFPPGRLGAVMGLLCLSYLFGDALAVLYLGALAAAGLGWRELFAVAALTLAVAAAAAAFALKDSPRAVGLPEPPAPPGAVHGPAAGDGRVSLRERLGPLVTSRRFQLVCLMNAGLTAVRETFNTWTPLYLADGVGLDRRYAGLLAFVFPLCGAVAAVAAGWAADRLGGRVGRLVVGLLAAGTLALAAFATADLRGNGPLALALIGAVALFLMGPYTFCSGLLALHLGGKRAAAAAAGIADGLAYLVGAVVAGELAGRVVAAHGFGPLWAVLAVTAVLTLAAGAAYRVYEARAAAATIPP